MKETSEPYQGPRPPVIRREPPRIPPLPQSTRVAATPACRSVTINGVHLTEAQLAPLEELYRTIIRDGEYWYDSLCGAWGRQGGPCLGLIQPGLNLGGPLRADASSGNTGVFINGRQLHLLDVLALQQITPVFPGRYWVDEQGNFGWEGGPMMGNLQAVAALARASGSGAAREGILSTWDKTGVAVFSG